MSDSRFVFLVCQVDTEPSIKRWIAARIPSARFAFSRPGLLTYKLTDDSVETLSAFGQLPLIRTYGLGLGSFAGDRDELVARLRQTREAREARLWHLWRRDRARVGEFDFEPFADPALADQALELARDAGIDPLPRCNQVAERGEAVFDLIAVDEGKWLLGTHVASSPSSCWVGGVPPLERRDVVSRAYYKLAEALRWSELPIRVGDLALEIGSAPGGACQILLELGLKVIGVDPAAMDRRVLDHPNFEHVRMRSRDLQQRRLSRVAWLFCDANLVPEAVLDELEPLATSRHLNLRGAVLTLKMPSWERFDRLDDYVARITSWGWRRVRVRHRAFDRQELAVVAER